MKFLQGGRTNAEMSLMIGASSANTWRNRLEKPETLTLKEAHDLCMKTGARLDRFLTERISL